MLYKASYQSPLGEMSLLSDETYLLGLWFNEQKYFGSAYDLNFHLFGLSLNHMRNQNIFVH